MTKQSWIFTFGYDHTHPVTGERLEGRFVRVSAETYHRARDLMIESFGNRWAFQYRDIEHATGGGKHDLREIPFLTPEEIRDERMLLRISQLVTEISRPLWIYRAANGMLRTGDLAERSPAMYRSSVTRRRNAVRELDALVRAYGREVDA